MSDGAWLVVAIVVTLLAIMVVRTAADGQPFHQPGQSDRTVIYQD